MEIDIRSFIRVNVTDSCSVWNIISSQLILSASLNTNCFFSITKFVEYECLFKPRSSTVSIELELINKLRVLISAKSFSVHSLTISDLQEIEFLQRRKRLGLGELSSIAFAKRTNLAFLTDDKNARKLAKEILGREKIQTTPHLLGWLFVNQSLSDSDLEPIISDHIYFRRPLEKYYREVWEESLKIRLLFRS